MSSDAMHVEEPSMRSRAAPDSRRSEIGAVPEDWDICTLGSVASFRTGPFGSALHKSDYIDGGIPVINPMHIVEGELVPDPGMSVSTHAAQRLSAYRFRRDDIVMGRRGDMGRCALITESYVGWLCGTGSMIIRCSGAVEPHFVQRVLTTPRVIAAIEEASVGSTMVNLNQAALSRLQIQCPSFAEQRAIAEALSDVDRSLAAFRALIAKKGAIKHAAMQQLLTGKTRLPGFHDEWRVTCVGAEFHIELGKMLDVEKNVGVRKPFVGNQAVQWGVVDTSDLGTIKLRPSDLHRYRLRVGDLLVCEGGEIGRAAIWKGELSECYYQKALHRLRPKRDYDACLMLYLFRHLVATGTLLNYATQTSIAHLPKDRLGTIPIPRPSPKEQAAIASALSDMETEIAAIEARHDKTRAIKEAMMQQLLTGRIRLLKPSPAESAG